jgi:pimeloyl-ACP methyl ester carboxylesterase
MEAVRGLERRCVRPPDGGARPSDAEREHGRGVSITSGAVPRRISILALSTLAALSALATAQAKAASSIVFRPCPGVKQFSCGTLNVALDRSGALGGAVGLSVERLQTGAAPSAAAVVALAGGPGQAAIPLAQATAKVMAPALGTRDLLVFDQRGTGSSGALECSALEGIEPFDGIGQAFERCAAQIGSRRGSYTTQESVSDIEAIRQATGYGKLVLFGVSYGTKVALEYAERYPQNVEALVLDSVVPSDKSDPFSIAMFAAMKPVLEELCSARACASISPDPLGDIAQLVTRLSRHALIGYVYDGSGHRRRSTLSNVDLLNLIGAGDLNPALRALLPASVRSALTGDPTPLLRLNLLSEGLIPNLPGRPLASSSSRSPGAHSASMPLASSEGIDEALFVDTTCEEASLPWQRTTPPNTRLAEGLGALRSLPTSDFYPFDKSTAWADSVLPGCAHWPNVAPAPPPTGPLPSAPTLILSGAQDLRTPTAGAESVAARIAGAQLVVVPFTGHSVLGTDLGDCAQRAVKSFFSSGTAQPCTETRNLFSPTPLTPRKLGLVNAVGGLRGREGSTLAVVLDTIVDLERQVIGATLQAEQELPSGSSFGGLRGGYARITSSALSLHRLSFVNGVRLTGKFEVVSGHLRPASIRVEGSRAATGTVRIGASKRVTGTLDGMHFDVSLAKVKLASTGAELATGAPLSLRFPQPALARLR